MRLHNEFSQMTVAKNSMYSARNTGMLMIPHTTKSNTEPGAKRTCQHHHPNTTIPQKAAIASAIQSLVAVKREDGNRVTTKYPVSKTNGKTSTMPKPRPSPPRHRG